MSPTEGITIVFSVAVLATGLWMVVSGLKDVRLILRARSWPGTEGVVRKADLTVHTDSEGNSYGFTLEYSFAVGGSDFTGNQIFPGSHRTKHGGMDRYAERYRVRDRVQVRYDPKNPTVSLLETKLWILPIVMKLGIGGFFCVLATALLVFNPAAAAGKGCGCQIPGAGAFFA